MNRFKVVVAAVGLTAALVIAAACSNGEASTTGEEPPASTAPVGGAVSPGAPSAPLKAPPALGAPVAQLPVEAPAPALGAPAPVSIGPVSVRGVPAYSVQTGNSQAGIWVSGQGKISLEPDLALLNVGVEATKRTVAEARDEAARSMDAIVTVLHARGIENKDIQTRFFNISPRYEFREVFEGGIRSSKQVLVGYQVNNSAAIKIRDLDAVGPIIDEVATAGGDNTRINGISFTVEDPRPMMAKLREEAVRDAMAKAQQFADLTGVGLGRLVFISESGGGAPVVRDFARVEMAMAAPMAAPSTSISGGELELTMNVSAVFDIL